MGDEHQEVFKDLPKEVYAHFGASYLYQDQLSWGRTQLLVAIEAGTLAAAFALRPILAIAALLLGALLMAAIWRLVERDWEVRDHHRDLLGKVHKPLDIRMTKEPCNRWWRGSFILRRIFYWPHRHKHPSLNTFRLGIIL